MTAQNTKETKPVKTLKEIDPARYVRLKADRLRRRQVRRKTLKEMGFRPNRKMTKDKRSGKSLKELAR